MILFSYQSRRHAVQMEFSFLLDREYAFSAERIFNFLEEYRWHNGGVLIFTYDTRQNIIDLTIKNNIGNVLFETNDLQYYEAGRFQLTDELFAEIRTCKETWKNKTHGLNERDFRQYLNCYARWVQANADLCDTLLRL